MMGQRAWRVRWAAIFAACLSLLVTDETLARAKVGEPAPPFSGTTFDGQEISLDQLRGNVVIVNFWATWCAPCRVEMPLLDGYLRAREKNGLRVIAVTTDANRLPKSFSAKLDGVTAMPLLRTFRGDYAPIGRAIPTNFIIDKAGVVRYAKAAAMDLDSLNEILVPLLNEPAPPTPATTAPSAAPSE
jgi:cytochrome c biogenesis protein CcmG/thiol:disulfide interchange protein DsbE